MHMYLISNIIKVFLRDEKYIEYIFFYPFQLYNEIFGFLFSPLTETANKNNVFIFFSTFFRCIAHSGGIVQ